MTTEQMNQLIQAAEAGDDVRAVTLALAIAASRARSGDATGAMAIRSQVDRQQVQQDLTHKHCERRLQLVGQMFASIAPQAFEGNCNQPLPEVVDRLIRIADGIIFKSFCNPIGGDGGFPAPGYDLKPTKGDTK